MCDPILSSLQSDLVGTKTKKGYISDIICQRFYFSWQFLQKITIYRQMINISAI